MLDMQNKVAVVTGGSSGIGLATAEEFVARGAKVVITGRREDQLRAAASSIGESCSIFKGDVSSSAEVHSLYQEVAARHGRLDIVIANAGAGYHSPLGSITEQEFDQTFNTNAKGVLFTAQSARPF